MAAPENAPQEPDNDEAPGGGQQQSQGGNADFGQQLMAVRDFISELAKTLPQQPGFPKQALDALMQASQAFNAFVQTMGGGQDQSTMGAQSPDQAGMTGAVPADQPMGRNVKAVPA